MRRSAAVKVAGGATAVIVTLLGLHACHDDPVPTAPEAVQNGAAMSERVDPTPSPMSAAVFGGARGLGNDEARRTVDRVAWVGEVHNRAMHDLVANRTNWVGSDRGARAHICAGILRLARKYLPEAEANAGRRLSRAEERELFASGMTAGNRQDCANSVQMALFSGASMSSGAWEPYAWEYLARVEATDGTASSVATQGQHILTAGSHLDPVDFEVLAAVVSLGTSSAYYWNWYEENGGFDGQLQEPMSLFLRQSGRNALKLAGVDILGCIGGGLLGGSLGCAYAGLSASGGFLVSIL